MLGYFCKRGIVVNFLIVCALSLGVSSLLKLGLLLYKMSFIKQRGYRLKIKSLYSLLLSLDVKSKIDLLVFVIPMVNLCKETQNVILYEINKDAFLRKMLQKGVVVSKYTYNNNHDKHNIDADNSDRRLDLKENQKVVSLMDYQKQITDRGLTESKPKVYAKVKRH